MLPLIAALVAGDIVATEDGNGTLKTILTRSVDRGQVFAAKTLAAMTYAATAVFLSAAVATVAGVASWGFHHVITLSGTVVSAPEGLLLVFAANACYLIPLLTVVVHRRAALDRHPQQRRRGGGHRRVRDPARTSSRRSRAWKALQPYLLTEQFEAWQGLLRTPTDWAPIWHSAWVCALYAVPALFAAYLVFLRRDVAGG